MNKWQRKYIDTFYKGKIPRTKEGRYEYELLGKMKSEITVEFQDGKIETYRIDLEECNMPKGIINVEVLAGNLALWARRRLKMWTR